MFVIVSDYLLFVIGFQSLLRLTSLCFLTSISYHFALIGFAYMQDMKERMPRVFHGFAIDLVEVAIALVEVIALVEFIVIQEASEVTVPRQVANRY